MLRYLRTVEGHAVMKMLTYMLMGVGIVSIVFWAVVVLADHNVYFTIEDEEDEF